MKTKTLMNILKLVKKENVLEADLKRIKLKENKTKLEEKETKLEEKEPSLEERKIKNSFIYNP